MIFGSHPYRGKFFGCLAILTDNKKIISTKPAKIVYEDGSEMELSVFNFENKKDLTETYNKLLIYLLDNKLNSKIDHEKLLFIDGLEEIL